MDKQVLVQFTREFAILLDAGLPLVQGLEILANGYKDSDPEFAAILTTIKTDVEGERPFTDGRRQGTKFSDALRKHPDVFDDLYVNLVVAGELGRILDTILNRLAGHLEKDIQLTRRFEQLVGKDFAEGVYWLIRACVDTMGKKAFGTALLDAPHIGPFAMKIECARFSRTMSTLLSSGVPILDAIEIAAKAATSERVQTELLRVHEAICTGKSMSEPMAEGKVFPNMMIQMIAVGEQTGALDTMLNKIADFYEDEVDAGFPTINRLL